MVTLAHYKAEIEEMRKGLAQQLGHTLNRRIHGSVTTMEAAFAAVLARSIFCNSHSADPVGEIEGFVSDVTLPLHLHHWGGSFRRVPEGFILPAGTHRMIWQRWCVGRRPLRLLNKHDMSTRAMKIRLAEFQRLMRVVGRPLTQEEIRRTHSSPDSADLLFAK
ncbi:hypothetical protein ON010_g7469 [Phytophthora cinnamomi]|nr:hypothetical protein ON010_g7469 [Phytophthora cinnamomi]